MAAALGLIALAAGLGVVAVAGTYTLGATVGLLVAVLLAARRVGLPRVATSRRSWRRLTRLSLPYGVQDVFGVLLAKVDIVILSLLASQAAVGRYGGAYRLLEATFFLASSVNGAFAAMYTYLGPATDPPLGAVVQRSIKLLLVLLVPCAVVLGVLAEPVSVAFLGGDFERAAEPLRLLAPTVVLIGLVYLATSLLVSRGNPRRMVVISAAGVTVNAPTS
ncbi:MAG: oligosaccharide flippase family protein [Actinobacteria bacterium]|nr:oligosaccharide flippase family protein [Actinomycetota bacterium]